jgi:hypothetical protein
LGKRGPHPGAGQKRGGRKRGTPNKATAEVKSLVQQHGAELVDMLLDIALTDESSECRTKAAQELLNRGYGRAVATTQLAGFDGGPLSIASMPLDSLQALAAKIVQTLAEHDKDKGGGG